MNASYTDRLLQDNFVLEFFFDAVCTCARQCNYEMKGARAIYDLFFLFETLVIDKVYIWAVATAYAIACLRYRFRTPTRQINAPPLFHAFCFALCNIFRLLALVITNGRPPKDHRARLQTRKHGVLVMTGNPHRRRLPKTRENIS